MVEDDVVMEAYMKFVTLMEDRRRALPVTRPRHLALPPSPQAVHSLVMHSLTSAYRYQTLRARRW